MECAAVRSRNVVAVQVDRQVLVDRHSRGEHDIREKHDRIIRFCGGKRTLERLVAQLADLGHIVHDRDIVRNNFPERFAFLGLVALCNIFAVRLFREEALDNRDL